MLVNYILMVTNCQIFFNFFFLFFSLSLIYFSNVHLTITAEAAEAVVTTSTRTGKKSCCFFFPIFLSLFIQV